MKPEISELLKISDYFGKNKEYVIAGNGSISFKDEKTIWITPGGSALAGLTEDGLISLSRERLRLVSVKRYSDDTFVREEEVKDDIVKSILDPIRCCPPAEISLHEIIQYKFVVRLNPTIINGLLCSRNARNLTNQLFGDKVLFISYTDPGYSLFKKLNSEIASYREKKEGDPGIIFLENQGILVSADHTSEIKRILDEMVVRIGEIIAPETDTVDLPYNPVLNKVLPAIRMLLSVDSPKIIRFRHNSLIAGHYHTQQEFQKISHPLTPDIIASCRHRFLFIEQSSTPERMLESFRGQLERFIREFGFMPKIVVIKDMGVLAVEDFYSGAGTVMDIFEGLIKICHYAFQCGGTKLLTPDQITFIDQRKIEESGKNISQVDNFRHNIENRVVIVTGGAQGFGAGVAQAFYSMKANVVVADMNEERGTKFSEGLNNSESGNIAIFVKTDVSDPVSVQDLISTTVKEFGGLDIMISNAGILKAGGLDEMEPDIFSKTTEVNYNGYFHCAKYASEVLKIQNKEKPEYFSDIIQINSKSGLRGSNRNFAYAGAKFGGIGLTQSFALELAPYRIKVNSICPGNFYEGPLWSDPQNGLFVQYLRTGKVPGAKNIEDVKKYYEEQVPMKRGCRLEDLMKAILYVIDQEYETGQAVPVTGGQVMLG
jgi:NAD(P)-dependent dehydrogenase (short-subunit alcohol dehydrogenase family)/rhamnose utilization protein RhaD (predicted bifunctional aldolase and dehydrogenase)